MIRNWWIALLMLTLLSAGSVRAQGLGEGPRYVAIPFDLEERANQLKLSPHARTVLLAEWSLVENVFPAGRAMQASMLEAAAKGGHGPSSHRLATRLLGSGPDGAAKAFPWMLAAAQAGIADAQFAISTMLVNAHGVTQDKDAAREWLALAARFGHQGARQVARVERIPWQQAGPSAEQLQKLGTDQAAYRALYDAALSGPAWVATRVAARRYDGAGVQADKADAMRWLSRAAFQGDLTAMRLLGRAYGAGDGVSRNLAESLVWLQLAASKAGNDEARRALQDDLNLLLQHIPIPLRDQVEVLLPISRWADASTRPPLPGAGSRSGEQRAECRLRGQRKALFVYKDPRSLEEGEAILATESGISAGAKALGKAVCIVDNGLRAEITQRLGQVVEIAVLEGPKAGCRGVVSAAVCQTGR